jgi:hypothetical protein
MKTHEVQQGECMASIAALHEVASWRQIYYHACNEALRSKRPDPFTLKQGDIVQIPDLEWLRRVCATGKTHIFGHKAPPPLAALIHLRFDMSEPQLYANTRYELTVDGQVLEGFTGSDAQLHHAVPLEAKKAKLELWIYGDEEDPQVWEVDLRHLDPMDTVSGMKGRMLNLGYLAPEDTTELGDDLDDEAQQAMQAFAATSKLDPSESEQLALESRARPAFEAGEEYLKVGRSYQLQLVPKLRRVHLRFAAAGGLAYAERPFELEIDGTIYEGQTSDDAELDIEVPASAKQAELRINLEGLDEPEVWTLDLDETDDEPGSDVSFKAGLVNLGFLSAGELGDGAAVERATSVFQAVYGLEPTGKIDDSTFARMQRLTG